MRGSEKFRRIVAIIGLMLMVAVFVGGPVGTSNVHAEGGGTGHPPPDSTGQSSLDTDIGTLTTVGIYLSSASTMLL